MLFGIRFDDGYIDMDTLVDAQNSYAINECVPRKYLAIGQPFHHAIICMSQSGEDAGAIYIWEPPLIGEIPDAPTTEFVSCVAPTLSAFLDSLRDDP